MGITVIIILLLFFTSVLSSQEINLKIIIAALRELWKVLFLVPSVCGFLYVYELCQEPPNGFAPNSHGRRVWPRAQTSLKVGSKIKVTRDKKWHFRPYWWPASRLCLVKHLLPLVIIIIIIFFIIIVSYVTD